MSCRDCHSEQPHSAPDSGMTTEDIVGLVSTDSLQEAEMTPRQLLSDETTRLVMQILLIYVTPTIGLLGAIGNVFSLMILVKHGLHKCSNILLFCLAVTDLTFLISYNSIPKILYDVIGVDLAWAYSETAARAAYILYFFFNTLDYAAGYISLTIPMFITMERMVAVFMPLRFHEIITPRRTWFTTWGLCVFWFTYNIYTTFWFKFGYVYKANLNMSVGVIQRSALYYSEVDNVVFMQDFTTYISMKIPPCFTLVGCIFISIKIKMASSKRKKLASASGKEASSNRTTKMLLAVCCVYTVTCTFVCLPTYIPQYVYFTVTGNIPSNVGRVGYVIMNLVVSINSSCNFVVYVGMNKNFRDTYKSLFVGCCRCRMY
ncbi:FMRFamide receptor-like [Aplysia californica]|uniref:FMRFamide receptor-like n=1 Tax=Aplysia californica TaxID=6500 RepID=A0ABM0JCH6_APLCA|nr:FMRFamide receptor-like [Aplysia californica]